jgi:GTP-binding protein
VINEVFDLFAALDATDEQLDFPILYGSGRNGWMSSRPEKPEDGSLAPLFDLVVEHVPEPTVAEGPFRMIGTILEANPFLGRIITGRIHSGSIKPNQRSRCSTARASWSKRPHLQDPRLPRAGAPAGRRSACRRHRRHCRPVEGHGRRHVLRPVRHRAAAAQPIDPPTVTMSFLVNDSPLAGTEGDKVTSRVIRDRLLKEAEGNVALKIEEVRFKDSFYVSGRGELQLAVLIETMRREGFELAVSRPRVVMHKDESGTLMEPIEEVVIDVDEEHSGVVVQKMSERKAEMTELRPSGGNRVRLVFHAPTRGLIGYQSELLTDTRGTAVMNRLFHDYQPYKGEIGGRTNGVLLSNQPGEAVAYAMFNLEDRGPMIIEPGDKVYHGHDHRHSHPRQRSRGQCAEGQAAHQHPLRRQGRGRQADAADPHDARPGAVLDPGRRADGSDAEVDPPSQALSRRQRPQALRQGRRQRRLIWHPAYQQHAKSILRNLVTGRTVPPVPDL